MKPNELTREIIGTGIEVHRELGPGKPEAAYERALAHELELCGLAHQVQKPVPVVYKGVKLECGYRLDVLVADDVVVEVKSVEIVHPIHRAQVLTYLKLGSWKVALLLNFNVAALKEGIERLVLGFDEDGRETAEARKARRIKEPTISHRSFLHSRSDTGDKEAELLAREVLAAATEVHRELGPGLLPSAYQICLCHELHLRGVTYERRKILPLAYKGTPLAESDEVELLVGDRVVVNSSALASIQTVQEAELLSQLRLGGWKFGLLINFNTISLREGLRRIVFSQRRERAARTSAV